MDAILNENSVEKMDAESILERIMAEGEFLDIVFDVISKGKSSAKFRCTKALLLLSESNACVLYPRIQEIADLLDSKNQIVKWNAIAILGNMASEDCRSVIEELLGKFYGFLACGELITANNSIATLVKIGQVFPDKKKKIIEKLLKIETYTFDTGECRNIAVGKVILALEQLMDSSKANEKIKEFARRNLENRRSATAKKAREFLRRLA
jgi:hypothetical protein